MKKIFSVFALLSLIVPVFSQEVEMADELRSSGKIYVVVAVLAIIFLGIIIYLVNLDRKITRLEKELNKK